MMFLLDITDPDHDRKFDEFLSMILMEKVPGMVVFPLSGTKVVFHPKDVSLWFVRRAFNGR